MKNLTNEELIEQNERNEFMIETIDNILAKLSEGHPGFSRACESKEKFLGIRTEIRSEADRRLLELIRPA